MSDLSTWGMAVVSSTVTGLASGQILREAVLSGDMTMAGIGAVGCFATGAISSVGAMAIYRYHTD